MTSRSYLGEFEQVVLLAVAHLREDGYGMSIRREIQKRTGRRVSIGAVYSTLDRLERKGLVRSHDGEPTPVRGGRAKRHFRMAAAGQRALEASREMIRQMWEGLELDASEGT